MIEDFSGSLVLRGSKILMFYNEEEDFWDVPSGKREESELSADAASRITENFTGCNTEVQKYQRKFKTTFQTKKGEANWQPYQVEIKGDPKEGEWIEKSEIKSKQLSPPLQKIEDKLADKL
jgi:ADP-ribose pyrophosphatase YjhB (NUDIX family)